MAALTIVRKSSVVLGLPEKLVNDSRLSVSAKYAFLRVLSQPAGKSVTAADVFSGDNEAYAKAALHELRDNGYIKITGTQVGESISDLKLEILECDDVSQFSSKAELPPHRITCKCGHWWMSDEDPNPDSTKMMAGFDAFWALWPQKYLKAEAKKKWLSKHCYLYLDKILESVKVHCASRSWQSGYIPNVTTWLNQNRWEDNPNERDVKPKMQQRNLC